MNHTQTTFIVPAPVWPALPERERPINRIREVGPMSLSTVEVLSVILGQSTNELASRIVAEFATLQELIRATEAQLAAVQGVGPITAAKIHAALELARRLAIETAVDTYNIRSPGDVSHILIPEIGHATQEHFMVLCLNTRNTVTFKRVLYVGSLNTSLVRIAEVFEDAVQRKAAAVIVAHNHPSGDPAPSPEDIALTRRLVGAGKLLEIDLLDHLIIAGNRYVSLRERNLGFEEA